MKFLNESIKWHRGPKTVELDGGNIITVHILWNVREKNYGKNPR